MIHKLQRVAFTRRVLTQCREIYSLSFQIFQKSTNELCSTEHSWRNKNYYATLIPLNLDRGALEGCVHLTLHLAQKVLISKSDHIFRHLTIEQLITRFHFIKDLCRFTYSDMD